MGRASCDRNATSTPRIPLSKLPDLAAECCIPCPNVGSTDALLSLYLGTLSNHRVGNALSSFPNLTRPIAHAFNGNTYLNKSSMSTVETVTCKPMLTDRLT